MFRSLLREVGTLLIGFSVPKPVTVEQRLVRPRAKNMGPQSSNGEYESHQLVVAGSVQFVGMDEIKRSLGAAWISVANIAYAIAEDVIRQHLSKDDEFRRHGDDAFLLRFSTDDKAEARAKAATIAQDIRRLLLERAPDSGLKVRHDVVEIDWVDDNNDTITDSVAETMADALRKVREEAEASAAVWRRHVLQIACVRYNPIWASAKRLISHYRILLDEETGKQAFERLSTVSDAEELREVLFELDCLLVGRAVQALHKLLGRGGKARIVIPVNFTTVHDRSFREQYFDLCSQAPSSYKKFIFFHLHGPMSGIPVARLVEIGVGLKRYAEGVLIETSSAQAQELTASSFHGVSLSAKNLPTLLSDSTERLTRFVTSARASGLRVLLHDADTVGTVEAAIAAQVDYVEGRAVAFAMDEPKSAYSWNPRAAA